jgi:bifunctional non-homologous end joining protein LigD
MPKPLPREFKPMLARPWTEPPEGPDWIFEVKWDWYRAIAIIEQSKVRLLSRNGLSLEKKFEKVVMELRSLDLDSAILDGEVVAVDQNGIPRFELLQRYQQKPQGTLLYYVFDPPISRCERSHRPAAFTAKGTAKEGSGGKRSDPVLGSC